MPAHDNCSTGANSIAHDFSLIIKEMTTRTPNIAPHTPLFCWSYTLDLILIHPHFAARTPMFC